MRPPKGDHDCGSVEASGLLAVGQKLLLVLMSLLREHSESTELVRAIAVVGVVALFPRLADPGKKTPVPFCLRRRWKSGAAGANVRP